VTKRLRDEDREMKRLRGEKIERLGDEEIERQRDKETECLVVWLSCPEIGLQKK